MKKETLAWVMGVNRLAETLCLQWELEPRVGDNSVVATAVSRWESRSVEAWEGEGEKSDSAGRPHEHWHRCALNRDRSVVRLVGRGRPRKKQSQIVPSTVGTKGSSWSDAFCALD